MNKYLAFYKSQKIEVSADTSYAAQQTAAAIFKAKKSYLVHVILTMKGTMPINFAAETL